MFTEPKEVPPNIKHLPFIWTYVFKDDGTRKARASCNRLSRMQDTITLKETNAISLDQTASNIFWSISVEKGHILIDADVSNAFAEAHSIKAPLYMYLDHQFHSWRHSKGRPSIPKGCGVKVLKVIQRHPESPRLWAI